MVEGYRRNRIIDALLLGLVIIAAAWLARLVYHNYLGGHVDRSGADAGWVGSVAKEDGVTTVVNASGSVWGGSATLVLEASIGVETGADPYMLGSVNGIAVYDERIYVLDGQVSVIRVYAPDGTHIADIGRAGEGPGEFPRTPAGIAIDDAGLLYVHGRSKIEVFTADGDHVDTWNLERTRGSEGAFGLVAPGGGSVLVGERVRCGERFFWRCRLGMLRIDEGVPADDLVPIPDLGYQTPDLSVERRTPTSVSWSGGPPKFVATLVWAITPDGDLLVGRADRYEFERLDEDRTEMVVSRFWQPVAVESAEYDWHLRQEQLRNRPRDGITQVGTYDLDQGLPRHKPAFRQFIGTHDGGAWVVRDGAGERLTGCDDGAADLAAMNAAPCWRDSTTVDAFDSGGRYLGEIDLPEEFSMRRFTAQTFNPQPWVGGDVVVAAIEDEAGTLMVRRYRIVPPAGDDG